MSGSMTTTDELIRMLLGNSPAIRQDPQAASAAALNPLIGIEGQSLPSYQIPLRRAGSADAFWYPGFGVDPERLAAMEAGGGSGLPFAPSPTGTPGPSGAGGGVTIPPSTLPPYDLSLPSITAPGGGGGSPDMSSTLIPLLLSGALRGGPALLRLLRGEDEKAGGERGLDVTRGWITEAGSPGVQYFYDPRTGASGVSGADLDMPDVGRLESQLRDGSADGDAFGSSGSDLETPSEPFDSTGAGYEDDFASGADASAAGPSGTATNVGGGTPIPPTNDGGMSATISQQTPFDTGGPVEFAPGAGSPDFAAGIVSGGGGDLLSAGFPNAGAFEGFGSDLGRELFPAGPPSGAPLGTFNVAGFDINPANIGAGAIGSFAGKTLARDLVRGDPGDQSTASSIGGTVGGAAGGFGGAAALGPLLGAWGGPLGVLAGAFLGSLAGGTLFAGEPDIPYSAVAGDFSMGDDAVNFGISDVASGHGGDERAARELGAFLNNEIRARAAANGLVLDPAMANMGGFYAGTYDGQLFYRPTYGPEGFSGGINPKGAAFTGGTSASLADQAYADLVDRGFFKPQDKITPFETVKAAIGSGFAGGGEFVGIGKEAPVQLEKPYRVAFNPETGGSTAAIGTAYTNPGSGALEYRGGVAPGLQNSPPTAPPSLPAGYNAAGSTGGGGGDWFESFLASQSSQPAPAPAAGEAEGSAQAPQTAAASPLDINAWMDQQRLQESGGVGAREGGLIPPTPGGTQPVPMTAHTGEFVIRPEAVAALGPELLTALNRGTFPAMPPPGDVDMVEGAEKVGMEDDMDDGDDMGFSPWKRPYADVASEPSPFERLSTGPDPMAALSKLPPEVQMAIKASVGADPMMASAWLQILGPEFRDFVAASMKEAGVMRQQMMMAMGGGGMGAPVMPAPAGPAMPPGGAPPVM